MRTQKTQREERETEQARVSRRERDPQPFGSSFYGGRGASFFFQERCTSGFKPERPRASTWSGVMAAPQVAEDGSRGSRIGTAGFAGVGYPDCQGPRVPAARLRTPALVAAPPQGFPREGPGYRLAGRPNPPGSQRRADRQVKTCRSPFSLWDLAGKALLTPIIQSIPISIFFSPLDLYIFSLYHQGEGRAVM